MRFAGGEEPALQREIIGKLRSVALMLAGEGVPPREAWRPPAPREATIPNWRRRSGRKLCPGRHGFAVQLV